jgi:hypothetical protein
MVSSHRPPKLPQAATPGDNLTNIWFVDQMNLQEPIFFIRENCLNPPREYGALDNDHN